MKEMLKNKLTSRKFWIAVAGIISGIVLIVNGNKIEGVSTLIASVVGYLVAEGFIDAKRVNTVIDTVEDAIEE
jgi:hypothetical protein